MRVAGSEKCGLVPRLADFLTCRFFPNGSRPRGTSIVIALGLIAAISAFTIGIASTMLIAIQNTASSKKALQAEYSAQGGVEMAKKELKGMGVAYGGITDSDPIYIKGGANDLSASTYFKYSVKGKDDSVYISSNKHSVPVIGTGSAGDDCKIGASNMDVGDPCNWNKLYYGDSVEVPLYVVPDLSKPDDVKSFKDLSINNFEIKVRTPCNDNTFAADCPRYGVDYVAPGAVVVNWQISGMCGDLNARESCGLAPTSGGDGDSSIREGDLGDGTATVPFTDKGVDVNDPDNLLKQGFPISNFMNNADPWASNGLYKPVLKLSFVNEVTGSDGTVPYLEYQILYDRGPLAASYTVSINGFAEGFLYSLSGVQSPGAGLFDFAVQN